MHEVVSMPRPVCVFSYRKLQWFALRYNARADAVDTSVAEFSTNATVVIDDQVSESNGANFFVTALFEKRNEMDSKEGFFFMATMRADSNVAGELCGYKQLRNEYRRRNGFGTTFTLYTSDCSSLFESLAIQTLCCMRLGGWFLPVQRHRSWLCDWPVLKLRRRILDLVHRGRCHHWASHPVLLLSKMLRVQERVSDEFCAAEN